jgi:DNA-binding FrmR family transcriptional regulator
MKLQSQETKHKLIARLRRVEGQIRGVENMLESERDCREIMQQLASIHSAIRGASRVFFQEYATACLAGLDDEVGPEVESQERRQQRAEIIQEMIALLDKSP